MSVIFKPLKRVSPQTFALVYNEKSQVLFGMNSTCLPDTFGHPIVASTHM